MWTKHYVFHTKKSSDEIIKKLNCIENSNWVVCFNKKNNNYFELIYLHFFALTKMLYYNYPKVKGRVQEKDGKCIVCLSLLPNIWSVLQLCLWVIFLCLGVYIFLTKSIVFENSLVEMFLGIVVAFFAFITYPLSLIIGKIKKSHIKILEHTIGMKATRVR